MARITTLALVAITAAPILAYVAKPLGFSDGGFW